MRPTATATISFGMVSIPVKLFTATESKASISFNMLHEKCKGRVKQQYICERDNNEVVSRKEMVKGYEFAKDQYVVFTPEEIDKMEEDATKLVDISEFLDIKEVDPIYYDGAYYLAENGGGSGLSAFWLMDAIASYQGEKKLERHPFQIWRLIVTPESENKSRSAVLICGDVQKPIAKQEIEFTDFLLDGETILYASRDEFEPGKLCLIILLPGEY